MIKLNDLDLDYIMELYNGCEYKDDIKYYVHELNTTTNKLGFFTDKFYVGVLNDHLADHHYYHQNINPKYNALVDKAIDALYAVYSSIDEENEVFKRMRSIL